MGLKNVCLVAHTPSEETKAFIRSLKGEWVLYQYLFHISQIKDVVHGVTEAVQAIHREINLEGVGRVLLAPPGMSIAAPLMVEALRGITGAHPELLVLIRDKGNNYIPCPETPIVNLDTVYYSLRTKRNSGLVAL